MSDANLAHDAAEARAHPLDNDSTPPGGSTASRGVDLFVAFEQLGEAKRLGARYDPTHKRWYEPHAESHLVQRWETKAWAQERRYIFVPFRDNDEARSTKQRS